MGGDGVGGSSISSVLQEEGDCLVVATSLGRISIISCRSLEGGGSLEECTLVSTQVRHRFEKLPCFSLNGNRIDK